MLLLNNEMRILVMNLLQDSDPGRAVADDAEMQRMIHEKAIHGGLHPPVDFIMGNIHENTLVEPLGSKKVNYNPILAKGSKHG